MKSNDRSLSNKKSTVGLDINKNSENYIAGDNNPKNIHRKYSNSQSNSNQKDQPKLFLGNPESLASHFEKGFS